MSQLRRDRVNVGFDSDVLLYDVPANTAIIVKRPDGSEVYRAPARDETWHLTYRGMLTPGIYAIELYTP